MLSRLLCLLVLGLVGCVPAWSATRYAPATPDVGYQGFAGVAASPHVNAACLPTVPASSLTFGAWACTGFVRGANSEMVYVSQDAVAHTLQNINGYHWLALCRDTTSTPSGWARSQTTATKSTAYLSRQSATEPSDPTGCMVFAKAEVENNVIVAVGSLGRNVAMRHDPHVIMASEYGLSAAGSVKANSWAMQRMAAAIAAQGGGVVDFQGIAATMGYQTRNTTPGMQGSYLNADLFKIFGDADPTKCNKPIVIHGNGALLRMADGLKYGQFDLATGIATAGDTTDDNKAHVPYFFDFYQCANISIDGFEWDGNNVNLDRGGAWNSAPFSQNNGSGIRTADIGVLTIENIDTHHHALDGLTIGAIASTPNFSAPTTATTIKNVRATYNGRMGLTIHGGIGVTVMGGEYSHNGRSTYSTGPAAGIDLEPDTGILRDVVLLNVKALNNVGYALTANSALVYNVDVYSSVFVGTDHAVVDPRAKRMRFYKTEFYGTLDQVYADATDAEDATQFHECIFSDYPYGDYSNSTPGSLVPYLNVYLINWGSSAANVLVQNSKFTVLHGKLITVANGTFINNRFEILGGEPYVSNQDFVANFGSTTLIDNTFHYRVIFGSHPADAFYINIGGVSPKMYGRNTITTTTAGKLYWNTWDATAGGFAGFYGEPYDGSTPVQAVGLHKNNRNNNYGGVCKFSTANSIPATCNDCDVIWNSLPATGGTVPWFWMCIGANNPIAGPLIP